MAHQMIKFELNITLLFCISFITKFKVQKYTASIDAKIPCATRASHPRARKKSTIAQVRGSADAFWHILISFSIRPLANKYSTKKKEYPPRRLGIHERDEWVKKMRRWKCIKMKHEKMSIKWKMTHEEGMCKKWRNYELDEWIMRCVVW